MLFGHSLTFDSKRNENREMLLVTVTNEDFHSRQSYCSGVLAFPVAVFWIGEASRLRDHPSRAKISKLGYRSVTEFFALRLQLSALCFSSSIVHSVSQKGY